MEAPQRPKLNTVNAQAAGTVSRGTAFQRQVLRPVDNSRVNLSTQVIRSWVRTTFPPVFLAIAFNQLDLKPAS